MTAGILLAAGQSRRFGGDKQLALFQGETLLARSARLLIESELAPRIVVLSGQDQLLEHRHRAALVGLDVQIALNPAPEQGMSSSIRIGLRAAQRSADGSELHGVIITVCDQIFGTSDHLKMLNSHARISGENMVASAYSNTVGVPAYFSAAMFPELDRLEGDRGAGGLIRAFRYRCAVVSFPEGAIDIDTFENLDRLS